MGRTIRRSCLTGRFSRFFLSQPESIGRAPGRWTFSVCDNYLRAPTSAPRHTYFVFVLNDSTQRGLKCYRIRIRREFRSRKRKRAATRWQEQRDAKSMSAHSAKPMIRESIGEEDTILRPSVCMQVNELDCSASASGRHVPSLRTPDYRRVWNLLHCWDLLHGEITQYPTSKYKYVNSANTVGLRGGRPREHSH